MLGVCSQDMQFIYVLPGWEGSAPDSRVLRDALRRRNWLNVPNGKLHTHTHTQNIMTMFYLNEINFTF